MKILLVVCLTLFAQTSFAAWNNPSNSPQEMKIVKKVLEENQGFDLAKTYSKVTGEISYNPTEGSYVFMDMNQDGGQDLAIIVEKTLCWDEGVSIDDCDEYSLGAEGRKLLIYFGQWDGSYKLVGKSASMMMNQGEGGVAAPNGDPLEPMSVEKDSNSLIVGFWGGSSQKWSFQFKVSYRQVTGNGYGFYLIHRQSMWMEWADMDSDEPAMNIYEESHDLVSGKKVVTQSQLSEEETEAVVIEETVVKVPLKRFSQMGLSDFFPSWY